MSLDSLAATYTLLEGGVHYPLGTTTLFFASVLFANHTVGNSPALLLCGFFGRCYLEVVSAFSSVGCVDFLAFQQEHSGWSAVLPAVVPQS